MSSFPGSPKLIKGGLVLVDPDTARVLRIISLQYNPDTLTRTLQVQAAGGERDRVEPLRLKGPAVETIKLEAEIDATDQLEFPDQNPTPVEFGIQPQLAALETLVYPTARSCCGRTAHGQLRHAGDRADASAAGAVRLEQEPHRAGADHRASASPRRRSTRRSTRSAPR